MPGTLHSFHLQVPNCTQDLYLQYDLCQLFHLSESYGQVNKPRNSDSSFSPAHSHSPIHIPSHIFLMYFPSHLLQLRLSGLPFNPLCIAVAVTSSESTCEHGPFPLKFFPSFGIPHMTDKFSYSCPQCQFLPGFVSQIPSLSASQQNRSPFNRA